MKFGCGITLADGQWWTHCGETDMGQSAPALCTACGGEYQPKEGAKPKWVATSKLLEEKVMTALEAVRWPCHCDWRYAGEPGQSVTDLLGECQSEGLANRAFTDEQMLRLLAEAAIAAVTSTD